MESKSDTFVGTSVGPNLTSNPTFSADQLLFPQVSRVIACPEKGYPNTVKRYYSIINVTDNPVLFDITPVWRNHEKFPKQPWPPVKFSPFLPFVYTKFFWSQLFCKQNEFDSRHADLVSDLCLTGAKGIRRVKLYFDDLLIWSANFLVDQDVIDVGERGTQGCLPVALLPFQAKFNVEVEIDDTIFQPEKCYLGMSQYFLDADARGQLMTQYRMLVPGYQLVFKKDSWFYFPHESTQFDQQQEKYRP